MIRFCGKIVVTMVQTNHFTTNFQITHPMLGEALEILCDDFQRRLYDEGYDSNAIRERVEAAKQAAHNHREKHH